MHIQLVECFHRLAHGWQGRNPHVLDEHILGRARAALHPVEHHHVSTSLDRQERVVVGPRRADLDVDRHLPVGDLAQLDYFDRQIVRAGPVGMAAGRALVDVLGQSPHLGDAVADLLAQQHPAAAGLGPLAEYHLDSIGLAQVVGVHAVARGQQLIDQNPRLFALLRGHPAVAGRGTRAHFAGTAAERLFGLRR